MNLGTRPLLLFLLKVKRKEQDKKIRKQGGSKNYKTNFRLNIKLTKYLWINGSIKYNKNVPL